MRSRFTAFVRRDGAHLWRTLHPDHDARSGDRAAFITQIGDALAFRSLRVLDTRVDDDGIASVLFWAVAQRPEASFVELSVFLHDGTGWRYLAGHTRPVSTFAGADVNALTIDSF